MYKAAVVQFPGNNCEVETLRALKTAGFDAELFRWNRGPKGLKKYKFIVLEGGFSYEDRGRSGLIISFDPIMDTIKELAHDGTVVMGVCNGAQALVESGLIPGVKNDGISMALAKNKRILNDEVVGTGFYGTWVYIKSVSAMGRSAFNYALQEKEIIHIPIAHGEGRFITESPKLEHELFEYQQVLFQYCNADGAVIDEYPVNPNGSMHNIAAVCNPTGNVMAIMPHPERGITPPGKAIFSSVYNYIQDKRKRKNIYFDAPKELNITPEQVKPVPFKTPVRTLDILIELRITDNEEYTLQQALDATNDVKDVTLKKYRLVRLKYAKKISKKLLTQLLKSGFIANTQKELCYIRENKSWQYATQNYSYKSSDNIYKSHPGLLVQYRDDTEGKAILERLVNIVPDKTISDVETGILWQFKKDTKITKKDLETLYNHRLFWNSNSQIASYIS